MNALIEIIHRKTFFVIIFGWNSSEIEYSSLLLHQESLLKSLLNYKSYYFRQRGFVIPNVHIPIFQVSRNIVGFVSCWIWTMKRSNRFWASATSKLREIKRKMTTTHLEGLQGVSLMVMNSKKLRETKRKMDNDDAFGSFLLRCHWRMTWKNYVKPKERRRRRIWKLSKVSRNIFARNQRE